MSVNSERESILTNSAERLNKANLILHRDDLSDDQGSNIDSTKTEYSSTHGASSISSDSISSNKSEYASSTRSKVTEGGFINVDGKQEEANYLMN